MADETKLIIGIDFGTTFSGAAYALTNRPDRVTLVTDWPNAPSTSGARRDAIHRSDKVPTQLRFPPGRGGEEPEWGFLVRPDAYGAEVLRLIKLGLESKQVPPDTSAGKTVADLRAVHDIERLIEQYLSGLLGVVLSSIRKYHIRALSDHPIHFMLTVPAIWSERSTQSTIRALQRARGFPSKDTAGNENVTVSVVSEPEAAAIYTLHKADRHDLQVGDTFLVVDAGGGTVDLITYRVDKLRPCLEVTEAAPGTGGMCGSQLLNSNFQQFLDTKLGQAAGYDDEVRQEALEHFELDTKRRFRTAAIPHDTFYVPLPGLARNPELGVNLPGRMLVTATELHAIFEPIVSDVIRLVNEQIIASNAPVRKIMLVGGFGQSEYLKERIQAAVQNRSQQQQIEIIQPEYAWQSVVQGAVLKGLSAYSAKGVTHVRIKARAARKHYGTEVGAIYQEYLHSSVKQKRWYDTFDGAWRVDVMDWFIRRGEIVSEQVPFFKDLSVTQQVAHGRPTAIRTEIYADDHSLEAPLACNDNVNVLCVLEADLSSIPEKDLDRRRGADGAMYYVVEFQIESIHQAASTSYTLIHKGHRYQTVTAEYV